MVSSKGKNLKEKCGAEVWKQTCCSLVLVCFFCCGIHRQCLWRCARIDMNRRLEGSLSVCIWLVTGVKQTALCIYIYDVYRVLLILPYIIYRDIFSGSTTFKRSLIARQPAICVPIVVTCALCLVTSASFLVSCVWSCNNNKNINIFSGSVLYTWTRFCGWTPQITPLEQKCLWRVRVQVHSADYIEQLGPWAGPPNKVWEHGHRPRTGDSLGRQWLSTEVCQADVPLLAG